MARVESFELDHNTVKHHMFALLAQNKMVMR